MFSFAQEEVVPLLYNPYIKKAPLALKIGNNIDSTFVYSFTNLELPVWDDFSVNKFVDYNVDYSAPGVTEDLFYRLMDQTNTISLPSDTKLCDSTHAHHVTVTVIDGVEIGSSIDYFTTPQNVWVNSLASYPLNGQVRTLYEECYILIDSIINGVPEPNQDTLFFTSNPDFVQDSARVFFADMNNPDEIWIDDFAHHNYRYAVNPMSLGVVTFDGVSNDGYPYEWGYTSGHGFADVLTSKPINMAGKIGVYLTFFYQSKGFGDSPEFNDSLILEFYSPSMDIWYNSTWGVTGNIPENEWFMAHIPITTPILLQDGFQFRFRNKATLIGVLDHWHIDYVNLRDNSYAGDTIIDDIAIVYPIQSLLQDYTSVPWDHYKNLANPIEKMKPTYPLDVNNNHTTAKIVTVGGMDIDGSSFSLPVATPNWSVGSNIFTFGVGNQPYFFPQTPTVKAEFDVKVNVATSSTNIYGVNDTTYFKQKFSNYYAYDDGTAEMGYGIMSNNALLAYKFEAYEADTLVGVLMKFIPTNNDNSGDIFLLTIWDDNNGKPGNIIYQDDYFKPNFPNYSSAVDGFKFYKFNDDVHIPVPETFYVGWEQIEDNLLHIGLDFNNSNPDKIFYSTAGVWINSLYQASLCIRPVVSTALNFTLGIEENKNESIETFSSYSIYPNPTNNYFTIDGYVDGYKVELYDLSGRKIIEDYQQTINIEDLQTGVYIVKLLNQQNEEMYVSKVIKQF